MDDRLVAGVADLPRALHDRLRFQRCRECYGRVRAALEVEGTPIGPLDTLIAGHALSVNGTVVTNNVREFSRVPALRVENWIG